MSTADDRPRLTERPSVNLHLDDHEGRLQETTHVAQQVARIDVVAPDGERRIPFSMVLDGAGLIVFSYCGGGASVLDRFAREGGHQQTIARFPAGDRRGALLGPAGVALGPDGCLYIPDADRHCIVKLSARGEVLAELGRPGTGPGELNGPRDVDVAADGRLLIADTENNRVQVWDPAGRPLAMLGRAGHGDEDEDDVDLPAGHGPGEFFRPRGVTSDGDGRIWVADTNNHRIQRLSAAGFELTFGREGDAAGSLRFPLDLRIAGDGTVIVVDRGGRRLQWFSAAGALERAIAPLEAIDVEGTLTDIDVDDGGTAFIPVGAASQIYLVRAGARRS